ncbi:MAG: NAD(P)/FAD-dependent oxidoreductase [Planctomycetota bacterium]
MNDPVVPGLRLTEVAFEGEAEVEPFRIKSKVAHLMRIGERQIVSCDILKRSIDRRSRPARVKYNLAVVLTSRELEDEVLGRLGPLLKPRRLKEDDVAAAKPPTPAGTTVIVGSGPAGLFAAWALLQEGRRVIVLERGDDVEARLRAVGHLWARGILDPESNPCFGEGGAGTFSDGKLITRDRSPWKRFVLETLVQFGAPSAILTEAQAHVGSDRLRRIVKAWREEMIRRGAEIRFRARVDDLMMEGGKVTGVVLAGGETVRGDRVIWACGGHSRESLEILVRKGVRIHPRSSSLGVRIEHPQPIVNQALAGRPDGPACEYKLKTRIGSRGVYSFCMCPGGVVVAATSHEGQQVVNGMSYQGKRSRFANSALVVELSAARFPPGPLGGLDYQRHVERSFFTAGLSGGGAYRAPAQRLTDFIADQPSADLPQSTYRPGLVSADLRSLLPADVGDVLLQAIPEFERQLRGYITKEAVLIGVETRTSCPLTVERSASGFSTLEGLSCVGEGAGHAGGILSAAYDALDVLGILAKG